MINIENLSFGYRRNQVLFDDLSIQFKTGNIYGLLGRNGAGKTTLLRLITGLLFPEQGYCLMDEKHLYERLPETMEEICFLPEEYELPSIRIDRYIKVNAVFYKKFSFEDVKKYIEEFELDENQKLNSLSYGQKKKFLIAFGLATNANFLVLDEPTNGLDIPSKSQFRKIMASSINEDRCIFISTHQVRDLENLIDPVVIIEKGKIIFNESVDHITNKLIFGEVEKYNSDIIYSEGMEGRKKGVMINNDNVITNIDLELLFNAVIQNSEKVYNIFNS